MKETGMVRRLDDLGRLVIPKEIRKMYKMKEGDSIEIYIHDGNICIRKFDEISPFIEQITIMCQILKEQLNIDIFFNSEEYLKRNEYHIDEALIDNTKVHTLKKFNSIVYEDDEKKYNGYIIPVVSYGNYYGSFIAVCNEKELQENELQPIVLFAQLLSFMNH